MRQPASNNPYLREKNRTEIASHIDEFLKKGGAIEYLSPNQRTEKPIGSVWRNAFDHESDA